MIAGAVGCWTVSRHRAATQPARPRHDAGACVARALGVRLGVRGAQAARGRTRGRGSRGARQAGAGRATLALGARHGRAAGQRAVHLVHSVCF